MSEFSGRSKKTNGRDPTCGPCGPTSRAGSSLARRRPPGWTAGSDNGAVATSPGAVYDAIALGSHKPVYTGTGQRSSNERTAWGLLPRRFVGRVGNPPHPGQRLPATQQPEAHPPSEAPPPTLAHPGEIWYNPTIHQDDDAPATIRARPDGRGGAGTQRQSRPPLPSASPICRAGRTFTAAGR